MELFTFLNYHEFAVSANISALLFKDATDL
jgi:hypothetical protein